MAPTLQHNPHTTTKTHTHATHDAQGVEAVWRMPPVIYLALVLVVVRCGVRLPLPPPAHSSARPGDDQGTRGAASRGGPEGLACGAPRGAAAEGAICQHIFSHNLEIG